MSEHVRKKQVDQLIQFLQEKLTESISPGELNGPELWAKLRGTGQEALQEAAREGLFPPPAQQVEFQTSEDDPNTLVVRISGLPFPPSV